MAKIPAEPPAEGASGSNLDEFKELYQEQRAQQARLRHAQQFLTSPVFYDLRLPLMQVTDAPEAVAARLRDVEYRLSVLGSLLSMMAEERGFLERTFSVQDDAPEEMPRTAAVEVVDG